MICPFCGTESAADAATCANCGQPLLEVQLTWQTEGAPPQTIPLRRTMTIGRVPGNDIVISDTALSRQHARIQVTADGIAVVDLGSLNGTFVNGERIYEEQQLREGDEIRVGRTVMSVSQQQISVPMGEVGAEATVALEGFPSAAGGPEAEGGATVLVEPEPAPTVWVGEEEARGPVAQEPWAPEEEQAQLEPEEAASSDATMIGQAQVPPEPVAEPEWVEPEVAGYLVSADGRTPIAPSVTLGRAEGNDIRLEGDRLVSRTHARIEGRDGGVWLEDLQSANGTFLNGEQVKQPVLLADGDEIRIGSSVFRFETPIPAAMPEEIGEASATQLIPEEIEPAGVRGGTDALRAVEPGQALPGQAAEELVRAHPEVAAGAPTRTGPAVTDPSDQFHLVVNFGPETGSIFPLVKDVTVIGRAADDADYDIQLNDRAVSRPHAKVVKELDGFSIHDLDSANGTWVNYTEEISAPRMLADGDVIKVGKTTLVYRVPASSRPAQGEIVLDPTAGQIVTVFSLKGGVGTTTIAVNLAVAFRQVAQQSVLIIDLSTERGAVGVHMNLSPKLTLADLPADPSTIDWDVIQSVIIHHDSGIDVLPAPPSPQTAELVSAAAVSAILPQVRARYKWVIVDTNPTFSELNLGVFDQSDLILLPLAPDMTTVKVMQSTLDVFAALQTPAERRVLVLNQIHPRARI